MILDLANGLSKSAFQVSQELELPVTTPGESFTNCELSSNSGLLPTKSKPFTILF